MRAVEVRSLIHRVGVGVSEYEEDPLHANGLNPCGWVVYIEGGSHMHSNFKEEV